MEVLSFQGEQEHSIIIYDNCALQLYIQYICIQWYSEYVCLLVCRLSKPAKQVHPVYSDTEDTLSTSHTRLDHKDLSSFDRASKKFLEEMKETFLRLEREAKVRVYTMLMIVILIIILLFRSWKRYILPVATIILLICHTTLPGIPTLCHPIIGMTL